MPSSNTTSNVHDLCASSAGGSVPKYPSAFCMITTIDSSGAVSQRVDGDLHAKDVWMASLDKLLEANQIMQLQTTHSSCQRQDADPPSRLDPIQSLMDPKSVRISGMLFLIDGGGGATPTDDAPRLTRVFPNTNVSNEVDVDVTSRV